VTLADPITGSQGTSVTSAQAPCLSGTRQGRDAKGDGMGQPRTMSWGESEEALVKVWRCRCWDCSAHRRHVLRKGALVALLLGISFAWATAAGSRRASTVDERSAVAEEAGPAWN
jgi:hypothetical protein